MVGTSLGTSDGIIHVVGVDATKQVAGVRRLLLVLGSAPKRLVFGLFFCLEVAALVFPSTVEDKEGALFHLMAALLSLRALSCGREQKNGIVPTGTAVTTSDGILLDQAVAEAVGTTDVGTCLEDPTKSVVPRRSLT